jgi:hypothetical protein
VALQPLEPEESLELLDRLGPPPRRIRRTGSTPLPRREPPPRPAPIKRPGRSLPSAPREKRAPRAGGRLLAILALFVVAASVWLIYATFQPGHDEGRGTIRVMIPAGADAGQIGDLLEAKGVIDSGTFFNLNATLSGRRDNLKPGDYTLLRGMAYGQALDALIAGPKAKIIPIFRLTIPEGLSRREVAPRLKKVDDLEGDFPCGCRPWPPGLHLRWRWPGRWVPGARPAGLGSIPSLRRPCGAASRRRFRRSGDPGAGPECLRPRSLP